MAGSIKKNFALNLINTLSGLLFPLITFPYVSRVLFAEGIGQVQFFQSIIDYVSLFAAIGIPLYAVREVAKIRDNKPEMSRVTTEVLLLHGILTLVGYLVIFILAAYVEKIQVDVPLFLLLSTTLFFNAVGVPWFYQGVEDFKYITIRTIFVRFFSVICLFLFVKTKDDIMYYAAISVVANVGSNVFNFFRLRKYLELSVLHSLKQLNLKRHLAPALRIFILNLIVSIYINLDSVMLGFLKNQEAVGYYTASVRLTKTILGVVSSLGAVLLPRFSNMISNGLIDEFFVLANEALSFIIAVSLPMFVGLAMMATPIIHLFCGSSFDPSILTLQIISPIILFIGLSGIIGMQILYPLGKEKYVIISTLVGAFVNVVLNWFLIPIYAQYGAAFATVVAEFVVVLVMILISKKHLRLSLFNKRHWHYVVGTLLFLAYLCVLHLFVENGIVYLLVGIFGSGLIYGTYLYINKDFFVLQAVSLLKKLKHKI
ncbi:MAG: flippase [Aminipila sp.]